MDLPESKPRVPGGWEWPDSVHAQARPASESVPRPEPTRTSPLHSEEQTSPPQHPQQSSHSRSRPKQRTWKPRQCRICLDTVLPTFSQPLENVPGMFQPASRVTYEDENGRLIRPCKCKGSSKYVHEVCLQAWRHADPAYGKRNFYNCPTCGFKYRISRLGWGSLISSVAAQIALTVLIFLTTIFILGFVSDFVIDICLDPWGSLWRGVTFQRRETYYHDDFEDGASGWFEHFGKGFASLGLLSFFKAMLASPIQLYRTSVGGRGRNTGRDRLSGVTWLMIVIGAATFAFTVWKGVRLWTRRTLERAGERVVDVQGGDEGDDDDD